VISDVIITILIAITIDARRAGEKDKIDTYAAVSIINKAVE